MTLHDTPLRNRSAVFRIGGIIIACAISAVVSAESEMTPMPLVAEVDSSSVPVRFDDGLSLIEFIGMVQSRNTSILTARNDLEIAAAKVTQESSIFEPKQFSNVDALKSREPLALDDLLIGRQPDPYPTNQQQVEFGVSTLFEDGATVSLTSRATRLKQGLDTDYAIDGFAGLTINTPLARGFGADFVKAGIRTAEIDQQIAELSLTDRTNALAAQAGIAFLDGLRVQHTISNLGKRVVVLQDLLASSERLIKEGRLPRMARFEIENSIDQIRILQAEREQEFYRYQADLLTLVGEQVQRIGRFHFVESSLPAESLTSCEPETCLATALQSRMDYQAQLMREQKAGVEITRADSVARPKVDFAFELGMTERGETLGDAFSLGAMRDNPTSRVMLQVEIPLRGNQYGTALKREAQLQMENEKLRSAELRLQIENEILSRRDTVESTGVQLQTWREIADRNRQQLAIETEHFERGRSDVTQVLRAQERALDTEATAFDARIAHAKAWIMLRVSQGALKMINAESEIFNVYD